MTAKRVVLRKSLYLLIVVIAFLAVPAFGGLFFLDPDTTFITTGVGTEFTVDLKVDPGVTGMKLYQIFLQYDKTRLDTVSVTEGPLMKSAGTTVFHVYLEQDSTVLRLESLILGYGLMVNGPGTLATIRFRAIGTGTVNMNITSLVVNDVNNNPMTATSRGGVFHINTPPTSFGLIAPSHQQSLVIPIINSLSFQWHKSTTPYHGDNILYDLQYGTDPLFAPAHTTSITGLTDSSRTVAVSTLSTARYYWKVRAYNSPGYETWSTPTNWYFDLTVAAYPGTFNLVAPTDTKKINIGCDGTILFDWSNSNSIIPNDTMTYRVYFGPTSNLPTGSVYDTSVKIISEIAINKDRLARLQWHYWRVKATNKIGFDTLSVSTNSFMTYIRGDANGNGLINLLDITALINFLYKGGTAPNPTEAGDANGNGVVNLLDVTYLISFLYKSGPAPVCP